MQYKPEKKQPRILFFVQVPLLPTCTIVNPSKYHPAQLNVEANAWISQHVVPMMLNRTVMKSIWNLQFLSKNAKSIQYNKRLGSQQYLPPLLMCVLLVILLDMLLAWLKCYIGCLIVTCLPNLYNTIPKFGFSRSGKYGFEREQTTRQRFNSRKNCMILTVANSSQQQQGQFQ